MQQTFRSIHELKRVLLFGSRAEGHYSNGSDIDIAVIGPELTDKLITRLSSTLNEDLPIPYRVDVVPYEHLTNITLKHEIDVHGIVIYQAE